MQLPLLVIDLRECHILADNVALIASVENFDLCIKKCFLSVKKFVCQTDVFRAPFSVSGINDIQFRSGKLDFLTPVYILFRFLDLILVCHHQVNQDTDSDVFRPGSLGFRKYE